MFHAHYAACCRVICIATLLVACSKEDPRCPIIAEHVASYALEVAAEHFAKDGPEMTSLKAQVKKQSAKVQGQCQTALRNDSTGGVSIWADCIVAANTAEEAEVCKTVGTRPQY